MKRYKICVYAISKNEGQFVNRWMNAVGEADLVVVVDTGSTDDTVEKLRARGAMVYEETIVPWRFDAARNLAMDHIPEDFDICVSNDIDEVFEPGWREKLEQEWKPEHTRARYWFAWSHEDSGKITKKFPMEKIHRRHGFRWVHPVHEVLEYSGSDEDNTVFIDGIVLHHKPDPNKSRGQYLPLLELSVQENPQDDRGMFWLGREYFYNERYEDAIKTLEHHLKLPTARWDEERSASMRFMAKAYLGQDNRQEAKRWLLRSAAECMHIREPWLELAKLGYLDADWPLCIFACENGLQITTRGNSYLVETASWGFSLHDLAAIAYDRLGLYRKALAQAQLACEMEPHNTRMKQNRDLIERKLRAEESDA